MPLLTPLFLFGCAGLQPVPLPDLPALNLEVGDQIHGRVDIPEGRQELAKRATLDWETPATYGTAPEIVDELLKRHRNQLRLCYMEHLGRVGPWEGEIELRARTSSGRATALQADPYGKGDDTDALVDCLAARLTRAAWPGGELVVRFTPRFALGE